VHPNGRLRLSGQSQRQHPSTSRARKSSPAAEKQHGRFTAINEKTGEPTLIQNIDGRGIQLRTFAVDSQRAVLLVAASIQPLLVRDANQCHGRSARA